MARNLGGDRGATRAVDEDVFDERRPTDGPGPAAAEDLERHEAEGAAMTLDEAVAYALEGDAGAAEHA